MKAGLAVSYTVVVTVLLVGLGDVGAETCEGYRIAVNSRAGCESIASTAGERTASGTVRKQSVTTYMYGTHVLVDDKGKTLYALRSDKVDLDGQVGRRVTVKGDPVRGYPVDFGPPYLDVKSLE